MQVRSRDDALLPQTVFFDRCVKILARDAQQSCCCDLFTVGTFVDAKSQAARDLNEIATRVRSKSVLISIPASVEDISDKIAPMFVQFILNGLVGQLPLRGGRKCQHSRQTP